MALVGSTGRLNADALLAAQLSLADADFYDTVSPRGNDEVNSNLDERQVSVETTLHSQYIPLIDARLTRAISPAPQASAGYEVRSEYPSEKSRAATNRYALAGIETFRTRLGFGMNHLKKKHQNSTSGPIGGEGIVEKSTPAANHPIQTFLHTRMRSPSASHSHIEQPDSGSHLMDMIKPDLLLCIFDWLYFPDAFAFAMTCKAIYYRVQLTTKKIVYIESLKKRTSLFESSSWSFCEVCLYSLPSLYFGKTSQEDRDEHERRVVCLDCVEMRQVSSSPASPEALADLNGVKRLVSPVWRPSSRVTVCNTGGRLWYRKRV